MHNIATHPTPDDLAAFALGRLAAEAAATLEGHLEDCEQCRERAATVAPDPLVQLLTVARTRFDALRASAPTPTLDGMSTPPAFAPTLAWDGTPGAHAGAVPVPLANHPKYRPVRRLGTGGMGTVWLAEHQVMHRPVAIKVIRPDLLARPGATSRFLREVRAAAKLHHPHIVTAFDAEPAGDSCLLVMEYVPGETLGERLESGPLPLVEALKAVRDAARGLAHAHAHGLVHRDVKPHNLIRSADGTTKVLDFGLAGVGAGEGIAAAGEGLTGAGMVVGTPDYIAPEQIADPHAADARADVYGLGCTLYHLLAGRSPMPDGSVMEKLAAQRTRPMDPIPGLPTAVAAVLAQMTAKDPNERYQSADEVVAALERCIRMVDPVRRRRRRFAAIAAGVLFAGLLIAAGVVLKIQRDNQEITVATNDDDIEVVMKRKGDVLRVVDKKTGQAWEIDTAKNEIAAADTPEGLAVKLPDTEPFVLRRNGRDVFTVTRVAKAAVATAGVGEVRRFDGHFGPVACVAISRDGTRAVTGSGDLEGHSDLTARIWDVATGREVHRLEGHTAAIRAVAFSHDGHRVLTGGWDGTVRLWDADTGKELHLFRDSNVLIHGVAFSRDGKWAVSGGIVVGQMGSIRMWDLEKKTAIDRFGRQPFQVFAVAVSPDDRYVLSGGHDGRARLWEADTGKEVRRFEGHSGFVLDVAFSPDGRRALTASADQTIGLWDVDTGKPLRWMDGHIGEVSGVAFSPDGGRAVSSGKDKTIRLWDLETGKELAAFTGHTDWAFGVAYAPDGRHALSASFDKTVRLWRLPDPPANTNPTAPRPMRTIDHRHPVRDIAWTPDGKSVVAVGGGLCRYDVVKGRSGFEYRYEVLSRLPGLKGNLNTEGPTQMVVADDGQTVVIVYGNTLSQFSLADGKALGFQEVTSPDGKPAAVTALAVSPDGRTAACAAGESLVFRELGKAGEPKPMKLTAPGPVVTLRYSPGGGFLVAAAAHPVGSRTELIVLDARTHEVVRRHTLAGMLSRVDISHDDKRLVAAGGVGDRGGFTVLTLPDLHVVLDEAQVAGFVEAARLSADGQRLTVERAPGAVEVWDVERNVRVSDQPLPADPKSPAGDAPVRHVAIAPDGRSVAVARGNEIGIWELPPAPAAAPTSPPAPQLVRTIEEERRFPQTPSFTPDGKTLLVGGYDYFAMYDPATGKELFSDTYKSTTVNTLLAASADGRTAAVACGNLFVYDLAARKRAVTIDMEVKKFVQITALTLSPDGQKLAYVAGPEVAYYDRSTGQTEYARPEYDKVRVFDLCYSPDGRYLAVASRVEADQSTRISLLDAKTHELVGRYETTWLSGARLQFSADGRQLFVAGTDLGRRTFLVLGVPNAKEVEREPGLPAGPEAPVPSPDGHLLALTGADGTVQIWDRGQKRVTFAWNPHTHIPPEFRPQAGRPAAPPRTGIVFSPDGRTLVTARGDQIRIWTLGPVPKAVSPPDSADPKLQGTWHSVSLTVTRAFVTFDGDRFLLGRTEKGPADQALPVKTDVNGTVRLEPAADGARRFRVADAGGITQLLGIYRLEGDTMFVCVRKTSKSGDYPTNFATDPATGTELLVLKKAAATPPERAAAEYVLSVGGMVHVDDREKDIKAASDLPKGPVRLTLASLFDNPKVTDTGLAVFEECTNLTFLNIAKTAVTDTGLAHFRGCRELTVLELADTKVTDAGLAAFAGSNGLRHLDLNGCTNVTDVGLAHFKECKNLRAAYLFDTAVTDAGLAHLAGCANLEVLGAGETRVGDAGLVHLKDCKRLTTLWLNGSQVTDRGLETIAGYKGLTRLSLQDTKVTDAGVKQLAGLGKLEVLDLKQTKVTAAGVAELSKARPGCRIEWDGGALGPPPKGK
jgi:WD40 repeat protein